MKFALLFSLGLLGVASTSCRTAHISPREAFLSRTPDRTNYFRLYEVSIESLRAEEDQRVRLTKNFVAGAREANCKACPELQQHLSRLEMIADKLHTPHVEFMDRLQK